MKITTFRKYTPRLCAVVICSAALTTVPILAQSSVRPLLMSPEQQQAQLNALTSAVGMIPDQVRQVQAINAHATSQTLDIRNSGMTPKPLDTK